MALTTVVALELLDENAAEARAAERADMGADAPRAAEAFGDRDERARDDNRVAFAESVARAEAAAKTTRAEAAAARVDAAASRAEAMVARAEAAAARAEAAAARAETSTRKQDRTENEDRSSTGADAANRKRTKIEHDHILLRGSLLGAAAAGAACASIWFGYYVLPHI